MKRNAFFLVFLTFWAHFDDVLPAPASAFESAPLADGDDECLPQQRRRQEEECSAHQKPVFVRLKPQTADVTLVPRGVPSEWNLTTPFTPPPLYVSMSLQI